MECELLCAPATSNLSAAVCTSLAGKQCLGQRQCCVEQQVGLPGIPALTPLNNGLRSGTVSQRNPFLSQVDFWSRVFFNFSNRNETKIVILLILLQKFQVFMESKYLMLLHMDSPLESMPMASPACASIYNPNFLLIPSWI